MDRFNSSQGFLWDSEKKLRAGKGQVVQPPQAAEFKGQQH
jgi:hypothetical protein